MILHQTIFKILLLNKRFFIYYNFRSEKTAEVPQVNTTRYGLRSFRSEAPRILNSLPNNVRLTESYSQFRRLFQNRNGFGCKCSVCSA